MCQAIYVIQTIRNGKVLKHFFMDKEESALQLACIFINGYGSECDRETQKTLSRLWWQRKYLEEIRTWNEGRSKYQFYVFKITVDPPSESFGWFLRRMVGLPDYYNGRQEDGFQQPD